MIRFPARGWVGGRDINELVSNVDIVPTLLETLGLPPSDRVQGRSAADLLDGAAPVHDRSAVFAEMTYHQYYDPRRCIRTERHKLILNFSTAKEFMDPSQSWRPRSTPRSPLTGAGAYHVVLELYDLESDPHELDNRAHDESLAPVRDELLRRLGTWMTETNDPLLAGAVPCPAHLRAVATLHRAEATS